MIKIIQERARSGLSPVSGEGRLEKYSDSYKEAIRAGRVKGKTSTKVNMTQTGAMLNSLRKKNTKDGFTIFFKDIKAFWHTWGSDTLPVRKLMPSEGEEWSKTVLSPLTELVKKITIDLTG